MKNLISLFLFLTLPQLFCSQNSVAQESLFADLKTLGIEKLKISEGFRFVIIGRNLIYRNNPVTLPTGNTRCAISKFNLDTKKLVTRFDGPTCAENGFIGLGKDLMVMKGYNGNENYLVKIDDFFQSGKIISKSDYFKKSDVFTNPQGTRTYFSWQNHLYYFDHLAKVISDTKMGMYRQITHEFTQDGKYLVVRTNNNQQYDDGEQDFPYSSLFIYDLKTESFVRGPDEGYSSHIYYEMGSACFNVDKTQIAFVISRFAYPDRSDYWLQIDLATGQKWFLTKWFGKLEGFECEVEVDNSIYYSNGEIRFRGTSYSMPYKLISDPRYNSKVSVIQNEQYLFAQATQHLLVVDVKTKNIVKDILRNGEENEFVFDESQTQLYILRTDGLYLTEI